MDIPFDGGRAECSNESDFLAHSSDDEYDCSDVEPRKINLQDAFSMFTCWCAKITVSMLAISGMSLTCLSCLSLGLENFVLA